MNPRALAQPLDTRWQEILDDVLEPMRVTTADLAQLAPKVGALSQAYNMAEAEGRRTALPLEARIAFSFPRDVPKGAASVRELVASRRLGIPESGVLRVLDLGAGTGKLTTRLVERGLDVVAVDPIPDMLEVLSSSLPETPWVISAAAFDSAMFQICSESSPPKMNVASSGDRQRAKL